MKALIFAAALVLVSLPANADYRHHRGSHFFPSYVSFGYGYPYYGYSHYYPSSYYGIGFGITPRYRSRRVRAENREVRTQKLYVYPAAGQSAAQLAEDRYQCHVWGADNSGYDPTLGTGSAADAANYSRAFTACMEGRDYVVK